MNSKLFQSGCRPYQAKCSLFICLLLGVAGSILLTTWHDSLHFPLPHRHRHHLLGAAGSERCMERNVLEAEGPVCFLYGPVIPAGTAGRHWASSQSQLCFAEVLAGRSTSIRILGADPGVRAGAWNERREVAHSWRRHCHNIRTSKYISMCAMYEIRQAWIYSMWNKKNTPREQAMRSFLDLMSFYGQM